MVKDIGVLLLNPLQNDVKEKEGFKKLEFFLFVLRIYHLE